VEELTDMDSGGRMPVPAPAAACFSIYATTLVRLTTQTNYGAAPPWEEEEENAAKHLPLVVGSPLHAHSTGESSLLMIVLYPKVGVWDEPWFGTVCSGSQRPEPSESCPLTPTFPSPLAHHASPPDPPFHPSLAGRHGGLLRAGVFDDA
jgi:hypothetical protein